MMCVSIANMIYKPYQENKCEHKHGRSINANVTKLLNAFKRQLEFEAHIYEPRVYLLFY